MEFKRNNQKSRFGDSQQQQPHEPDLPKNHWLDEDDEWVNLKEKVKRQAAEDVVRNRENPISRSGQDLLEPEKVELNIKLQLPKLSVQKFRKATNPLFRLVGGVVYIPKSLWNSSGKQKAALACAVCLIVGGGVAYKVLNKPETAVQGTSTAAAEENPVSHDPAFDIVLPEGREIPKEAIAYNSAKHFAKYDDEINTIKVSVSQQPVPGQFVGDDEGIQKMAESFGAREKLTLDDQDMYYGRQEKGVETLILAKKDVLIFILTTNQVGKESLKAYAYNLN